jgi:hypothetical protein
MARIVLQPAPMELGIHRAEYEALVAELTAQGHDVQVVQPAERRGVPGMGPEPWGGSTYRWPGDEWGSGYRFRRPGCYRLTANRTAGNAEVWLHVGRSPH